MRHLLNDPVRRSPRPVFVSIVYIEIKLIKANSPVILISSIRFCNIQQTPLIIPSHPPHINGGIMEVTP